MDRYFSAFEAGTLTPRPAGRRDAVPGTARSDRRRARAIAASDEPAEAARPVDVKLVTGFLNEALELVFKQLATPRAKVPLALLIEEIRVASSADIRPVYRTPGEVRIPADTERKTGLGPPSNTFEAAGIRFRLAA